ncbi:MAG TPA: rhomboid family intramembrane serine protease [Gammaproteobacteria bacterium]|nr:rhomboid family intramembrane serine protease [Gammaproteobacteria bacterium]
MPSLGVPETNEPTPYIRSNKDARRLRRSLLSAAAFTALLWLIAILEFACGAGLAQYGIYPRHLRGLVGILAGPLIHTSWAHLAANTGPVFILGTALLYGYPRSARLVIPAVYLATGMLVWLFGRESLHLGASGLAFGVMFFICTVGLLQRYKKAVALSLIVFLLYGGMLGGLFPKDPGISFESHLAGALVGIVLGILLQRRDPPPPRKRYSWEDEPPADETDGNPPPPTIH